MSINLRQMFAPMVRHGGRYRGELLLIAANYSTPLVGLFASTIAAMSLSPSEMGAIQSVMLLSSYLSMLHLGAFHGLNRNLAFYFGRQDRDTGLRMVYASHFVARVNALGGVLFGSGLMVWMAVRGKGIVPFGAAVALTGILYCTPYATHISTTCRSGQHFGAMGVATLIGNAARIGHAWLPRFLGWLGYIISLVLEVLIRLLLFKKIEPYPATDSFRRSDIIELVRVGFPIMLVGYLASLFMIADQSMLALFLSAKDLGDYTPARLITVAIMTLPATMSVLFSPKIASRYGACGTAMSLRRPLWILLGVHLGLLLPVCVAAALVIGPIVRCLMPEYTAGIHAARISALATLGMCGNGALIVTTTLRNNRPSLWIYAVSLALMWAAGFWMARGGGLTIDRAALLRLGVSYVCCAALWVHAYWATRRQGPRDAAAKI